MNIHTTVLATAAAAFVSTTVLGGYMINQGSSAPTYTDRLLNFDEPGGPTGVVSTDSWLASHGIREMQAGDGVPQVGDFDPIFGGGAGWLGDGNSFYGNFGVFMSFDEDVSALSLQIWDPSGPPSPFGGGLNVILFNDGVEVWDLFVQTGDIAEPAWGGIGDEWFDLAASDGDVFDEVRILGFGFTTTSPGTWRPRPLPAASRCSVSPESPAAGVDASRRVTVVTRGGRTP